MAKQKSNLNWYFIFTGILILYLSLSYNLTSKKTELQEIRVELKNDIASAKGRGTSDYKFWAKTFENRFNILNASVSKEKQDAVSNLKQGQKVDLLIKSSDLKKLSEGKEDVTVIGLSLNGNSLMTQDEFYHNRELYKIRQRTTAFFLAFMLFLNGLAKIPQKVNYIIIGVFIAAIIIMRFFEIGIY
ncbi:hypothetical protein [uncultured Flavobacterium sp.]|uniref:hypothetical protein n=1 Tax=uncultured Flavobacterium sp. TaxID=165435 RepID=UPI002594F441|nr:hypothetical protein [uncultured Flavobacterium sp.]